MLPNALACVVPWQMKKCDGTKQSKQVDYSATTANAPAAASVVGWLVGGAGEVGVETCYLTHGRPGRCVPGTSHWQ